MAKRTQAGKAAAADKWSHPLPYAPVWADAKFGFIAIRDGNQEITVFDPDRKKSKVKLAWQTASSRPSPPQVTMLAIVNNDGPCLAAAWDDDGHDGPGIGVFRLDGTAIALRYALTEEARKAREADEDFECPTVLLRAVSLDGTKLAWKEDWSLHMSTVEAFVAGEAPLTFKDVDINWAAFDEQGVLYASDSGRLATYSMAPARSSREEDVIVPATLLPWEGGLVSSEMIIRGGDRTALDTRPWLQAILKELDEHDTFTLTTAASNGAMLCVGPGNHAAPHLCFVDLEGNLIKLQKRPRKGSFSLFSSGGDLVVISDKEVTVSAWPAAT